MEGPCNCEIFSSVHFHVTHQRGLGDLAPLSRESRQKEFGKHTPTGARALDLGAFYAFRGSSGCLGVVAFAHGGRDL